MSPPGASQACESLLGLPVLSGEGLSVTAVLEPNGVTVHHLEFPPPVGEREREDARCFEATSFRPRMVAARESTELFVVGSEDATTCVVERWTRDTPLGGWYIRRPPKIPPFGVSCPIVECSAIGIEGGNYVPVAERPAEPRPRRELVCRRVVDHPITDAHVDLEGRYLLLGSLVPRVIYQLQLGPEPKWVELYSESTLPELAHAGRGYLAHHGTLGRLYILETAYSTGHERMHIVLVDADNNGVFEGLLLLTQAQWIAQGFEGAVWLWPSLDDHSP